MSWSITFDSVELNNDTYNVNKITDDTTAEREINSIKTAGVDGVVLVSDRFDVKYITISGHLVGSSPSDLQTKIDTANELFARKDVNLDVTPEGGSTRRYVCRMVGSVKYNREFFHNDYVPFSVRLVVPEGVGKGTVESTVLTTDTATNRSPASGSHTLTLAGSASQKPIIKLVTETIGKIDLLRVDNNTAGTSVEVEIDATFGNTDYVEIDLEQGLVTKNGTNTTVPYTGELSDYIVGDNLIDINVFGDGYEEDAGQTSSNASGETVGYDDASNDQYLAQSFVAEGSGFMDKVRFRLEKSGSPNNLIIELREDAGGVPGSLVDGSAGASFSNSIVPTSDADTDFSGFGKKYYLRKGRKYWLVLSQAGTTSSGNIYRFPYNTTDNYAEGETLLAIAPSVPEGVGEWASYASAKDLDFRVYRGQGGSPDWDLDIFVRHTPRYL